MEESTAGQYPISEPQELYYSMVDCLEQNIQVPYILSVALHI